MVFGLFGRNKPAQSQVDAQKQLRTPSPSESISAITGPPQSPEPPPVDVPRGVKRSRSLSNTRAPTGDTQLPPGDAEELLTLIKKVPAKTLHSFVITHIPNASEQEHQALIEFFATLTPPPRLHCVRCHKDYVEVENTDRSCLVPHDDESAEVSYVGNLKSKVPGVVGTTYETLWGCCNKLVEGDGDQGPPDGWCYEGFHTTDVKRARFRADSTLQNDKLISCRRMRCFEQDFPTGGRERSRRAAAQKTLKEDSDEEEDYDEEELEREAAALEGVKWQKKKVAGHHARQSDVSAMEVEENEESTVVDLSNTDARENDEKDIRPEKPVKPRPKKAKAENTRPKSTAARQKGDAASPTQVIPMPSGTDSIGDSSKNPAPGQEVDPKPKPKKPRKSRKSTDGGKYVPPKNEEESTDEEEEDRPKRKKRKST